MTEKSATAIDDYAHAERGIVNITKISLGEDVREMARRFTWLLPAAIGLAVFIGFNLFATIYLTIAYADDKHSNAMWMALVYSEYDAAKVRMDAGQPAHLKQIPAPPQ